jgi:hypothetical protein
VREEQTVDYDNLISFSMFDSVNGDPTAAVKAFDLNFSANAIVVTAPPVEDVAVQSAGRVAASWQKNQGFHLSKMMNKIFNNKINNELFR